MRPSKINEKMYIFIDEAQDLSPSEIELIYKVNNVTESPVLNLFGDTNQMISKHGVEEWSQLDLGLQVYYLEENFRNTNQIVDYCNDVYRSWQYSDGTQEGPIGLDDVEAEINITCIVTTCSKIHRC